MTGPSIQYVCISLCFNDNIMIFVRCITVIIVSYDLLDPAVTSP